MAKHHPEADVLDSLSQLTPAEMQILAGIAKLKTSKEIAEMLGRSYRTVEVHRRNICKKLGLKGPNAIINYIYKLNLEI